MLCIGRIPYRQKPMSQLVREGAEFERLDVRMSAGDAQHLPACDDADASATDAVVVVISWLRRE